MLIPLGILGNLGADGDYWMGLYSAGSSVAPNGIDIDPDGNAVFGATFDSGALNCKLSKTDGSILWQKRIIPSAGGGSVDLYGLRTNSSGDVFSVGPASPNPGLGVILRDNAGDNPAFGKVRSSGAENDGDVAVDSSGNPYFIGTVDVSGTNFPTWGKASTTSIGFSFGYRLIGAQRGAGKSVGVDSSGNIYVLCHSFITGSSDSFIVKYNSSGTRQWSKRIVGSSDDLLSLTVDSSGNVYVAGKTRIIKLDSSGAITWQKEMSASILTRIVASGDYIYAVGSTFIGKFDLSGNLFMQRTLTGTLIGSIRDVAIGSEDDMYLAQATSDSPGRTLVSRLPSNGGAMGTYTLAGKTINYQPATYTLTDSSLTVSDFASYSDVSQGSTSIGATTTTPSLTTSVITI
jgi:hypothetical protein